MARDRRIAQFFDVAANGRQSKRIHHGATKPKRADSVSWGILEFSRMKRELENLLGRKVDLLTKKSIEQSHNWIRQREILETAQVIYVAG